MGQIKKVGDLYYIEFYARGLMYTQAAGSTEEAARKMLEQVESTIAQGESLTVVREMELDVFFEEFEEYASLKFSPKSLLRFKSAWKHWMAFLGAAYPYITKIAEVTPVVVESYKVALLKTSRPKVTNFTLLLLREILDYGIRIGFINDNPSLHITLVGVPTIARNDKRSAVARDLLGRSLSLEKVYAILKLKDVAQVMYWANFIPLKRMDVYN
jgi:hypothetical protein